MPDDTNPTPLPDRARRLLEQIEAAGGEWTASYAVIATVCDLARSTAQLAAADLIASGLVTGARTPAGTLYRRTDQVYRPVPASCTDAVPTYTDPLSIDAPARVTPAHDAPAQNPLPTPMEPPTATRTEGPLASAPTREVGIPTPVPSTDARPLGNLAVAEAMDAARAAGRSIEPALRARIGNAAQRLAQDEDVDVILAAARRLGEGGFDDLYTAVRAVKADRPMPDRPAPRYPRPAPGGVNEKMGRVLERVYGTWPRAQLAPALWEEKLGRIQERFLVAAVDAIAEEGGDFAPTWGKVLQFARRIGEPAVLAERQERAHQAEQARLGPRYPA